MLVLRGKGKRSKTGINREVLKMKEVSAVYLVKNPWIGVGRGL
jgi:hypothetical protein